MKYGPFLKASERVPRQPSPAATPPGTACEPKMANMIHSPKATSVAERNAMQRAAAAVNASQRLQQASLWCCKAIDELLIGRKFFSAKSKSENPLQPIVSGEGTTTTVAGRHTVECDRLK